VVASGRLQRPRASALVVTQLGNVHAGPLGADELAPWRPPLDDRDLAAAGGVLEADLVASVLGDVVWGHGFTIHIDLTYDGGHLLLETHAAECSELIRTFVLDNA
jgi:hypothetical protein